MQRLPSNSELQSLEGEGKHPKVFNKDDLLRFWLLFKSSVSKEKKKINKTNMHSLNQNVGSQLL